MAIEKMLILLDFNINSKGFDYWIMAIKLNEQNKSYELRKNLTMDYIYNSIGLMYKVKKLTVERAMRTARKKASETIRKKYEYNLKLTNKTVLELITRERIEKEWK